MPGIDIGGELVMIGGGQARDRSRLEESVQADIGGRAVRSPFLRRLDLASRVRVLEADVPLAATCAALLPRTEPLGAAV